MNMFQPQAYLYKIVQNLTQQQQKTINIIKYTYSVSIILLHKLMTKEAGFQNENQ